VLIVGGRLIDPAQRIDAIRDIRLGAGVVVEIGERLLNEGDERVLDATGCVVAPGFIDMHVHLRDPGYPEKETFATGTQAAARGGFTAIACMPNTNPAIDSVDSVRRLACFEGAPWCHPELVEGAHARVYPIAAITRGRSGEELLDYAAFAQAGAVAFSDDGNTVMNARVLRDAAIAARDVSGSFISHALDDHLHGDAVMNEGAWSRKFGLSGSPASAEDTIVARDLVIARETGKAWHIAHISTATSLALIQSARALRQRQGDIRVTCEVTPHHLVFSEEAVAELGAGAKVNPPLRTADDVAALRQGVRDGTVDAFASDHAPHTAAEKSGDIHEASVGFTGLEVAVGAYAAALPDLALPRFVELLSTNPARILGVPGGSLAIGARADVTIFAERAWRVDPTRFASKGRSTPFNGLELPRAIVATIVGGQLVFHA
jgi:dihydroorotase